MIVGLKSGVCWRLVGIERMDEERGFVAVDEKIDDADVILFVESEDIIEVTKPDILEEEAVDIDFVPGIDT